MRILKDFWDFWKDVKEGVVLVEIYIVFSQLDLVRHCSGFGVKFRGAPVRVGRTVCWVCLVLVSQVVKRVMLV